MAVTQTFGQVKEEAVEKVAIGVASAAFLSGGIGVFVIGLMTTLSEVSVRFASMLNWWNPSGPLVGKTLLGILAWLVSWGILHAAWKNQETNFSKIFTASLILIGLGFLLTFPPAFEIFAGG